MHPPRAPTSCPGKCHWSQGRVIPNTSLTWREHRMRHGQTIPPPNTSRKSRIWLMPVWAVPLKPTILLQLGFKVLSHLQKVPKSFLFPWKLRRIWLASCYSSRWEVLWVLVEHPRRTWTSPSIASPRVSVHLARCGAVIDYYSIFFFSSEIAFGIEL